MNQSASRPQPLADREGHAIASSADVPAGQGVMPHPLDLLFDKCEILADRIGAGQVSFLDAVDMAYSAADWAGLVDRYGDDAVQAVLADAFGGRR